VAFFYEKRLLIAQKLLSETGVILISIDDNEQAILKILCDSIFREQNFLTMFVRKTKSMTDDDNNGLNIQHEYLLAYAKNKNRATFTGESKTFDNYSNPDNDPNGIWTSADPSAKSGGESTYFPIENPITGQIDYPPQGRYWVFSRETMKKYIDSRRIKFKTKITKNQRGFIFKRYAETMEVTTL
jgi:adenine-specific DNA-methyltransferase